MSKSTLAENVTALPEAKPHADLKRWDGSNFAWGKLYTLYYSHPTHTIEQVRADGYFNQLSDAIKAPGQLIEVRLGPDHDVDAWTFHTLLVRPGLTSQSRITSGRGANVRTRYLKSKGA